MIYKVQTWKFGNSATGDRYDLSFSRPRIPSCLRDPPEKRDHPLELRNRSSILRAIRMIKAYGLSNDWDWMVTFTLDQKKLDKLSVTDRKTGASVPLSRSSYKYVLQHLTQFLRDQRKKYRTPFSYLLIPELHKDRVNYHVHGLMSGIPDQCLELHWDQDLRLDGYFNWPALEKRYGRCSLGRVRNSEAAVFYSLKYINKDLQSSRMNDGVNLYYPSHDLKVPELVDEPDYLTLSEEWINSNVMTGPFGAGYARNLSPEVCEEIKSSMNFHRICNVYGFEDVRRMSEENVSNILALMEQQDLTPYSDFVYDLFGNEVKEFD